MQKLSGIIKEYHSDDCLDYAKVQETLGTIYLMTANLPQAKTHFKRAFKIYEKIWADEPEREYPKVCVNLQTDVR